MKNPENRKPIEFTVPAHGEGAFYTMVDIGADFYGYYHRHREFQISYVVQGKGSIMLGNLIRPCDKDEIFLIKPNEPHLFFKDESLENNNTVHIIHLFFSLEKLKPFFDMTELAAVKNLFYHINTSKSLPAEYAAALKSLFISLDAEDGVVKLLKIIEVFRFLLSQEKHFVSIYSGLNKVTFQDSDGLRINAVIKHALENYKRNVTVEEVSTLIHMSPTAFCKFFKKHTKKTFVSFLNEIRIEKACQLLVNKRAENISEAAYQCGFNTAVHFNRVFRGIMKTSPTEFIATHTVAK